VWTVPDSFNTTSRIRVVARDAAGLAQRDDSDGDFTAGQQTGVDGGVGRKLALFQNAPNPFTLSTAIAYTVPRVAHVELRVYDVTGRVVRTLVDDRQEPDDYTVRWNGRMADGRELTRKMILVR